MKILSCDGGGIRGAVTTAFLLHLEDYLLKTKKQSIHEYFDFFIGTSTGGLIALCLASGMKARDVASLYSKKNADIILTRSSAANIWGAKYTDAKRGVFKSILNKIGSADVLLKDAKKPCAVVSYNLTDRKAEILSSVVAPDVISEISFLDAADSTSAAPTYFPSVRVKVGANEKYLIDGGVVCNQPSMVGIALARSMHKSAPEVLNKTKLLSVGTAVDKTPIKGSGMQGTSAWLPYLLDVLTDTSAIDFCVGSILGDRYLRINTPTKFKFNGVEIAASPSLDNGSEKNIKDLNDLGNLWWLAFDEEINRFITL